MLTDGFPLPNGIDNTDSFAATVTRALSARPRGEAERLAEDLLVTGENVSAWKAGARVPDRDKCTKLAVRLNLDADALWRKARCARGIKPETVQAIVAEVNALRSQLRTVTAERDAVLAARNRGDLEALVRARVEQGVRDGLATSEGRAWAALKAEVTALAARSRQESRRHAVLRELRARGASRHGVSPEQPATAPDLPPISPRAEARLVEALVALLSTGRGDNEGRDLVDALLGFVGVQHPGRRKHLLACFSSAVHAATADKSDPTTPRQMPEDGPMGVDGSKARSVEDDEYLEELSRKHFRRTEADPAQLDVTVIQHTTGRDDGPD